LKKKQTPANGGLALLTGHFHIESEQQADQTRLDLWLYDD
jgi:hypothetical protein